jgi:hypothetical protein
MPCSVALLGRSFHQVSLSLYLLLLFSPSLSHLHPSLLRIKILLSSTVPFWWPPHLSPLDHSCVYSGLYAAPLLLLELNEADTLGENSVLMHLLSVLFFDCSWNLFGKEVKYIQKPSSLLPLRIKSIGSRSLPVCHLSFLNYDLKLSKPRNIPTFRPKVLSHLNMQRLPEQNPCVPSSRRTSLWKWLRCSPHFL